MSFVNRRYLALWFPFLPTDRLRRRPPRNCATSPDVLADAPFAFVEKVKGALRLFAVDRRAQALGLAPGIALADARARVPDLLVFERDDHADQDWLERIADGCARYTPMVAIDPPDGLILDIAGCTHLFGNEGALAADIEMRCTALGMTLRHAVAATPAAAHALARHQSLPAPDEAAAIRRLPVAALGLESEATQGLVRAGLKSIGDLAARPLAGIAARFGGDAVDALRHLLGDADRPIAPRRAPPQILAERRFAEPVARTEYALTVLGELVAEAARQLEERKCGGRRFEAVFFRSDGLARMLSVETGQPTRTPKRVMRLLRERIDSLRDPIDPGFGFDLIRLAVPVIEPLAATQLKLEGGAANEAQVTALIDQLSTRLGRGRVRRLLPRDTHIPEQAQLALPAVEAGTPAAAWPVSAPGEPPLRPLHLFDPPQPIEVIAEVPDGPPHRFRWRRALHEVRRFEGPERIAVEWWRRRDGATDKPGLTRDYYRVEDARGRRFWIFRHGLYEEKPDPGWYMHGLFA
ncbi:Y-family DNA polymerase [Sphingomonas cavernae]|uniref:Y-family DNA polymerase n=1 Tax=Sphingomonas cavernae TaxID=2320861 RepID=UPI003B75D028